MGENRIKIAPVDKQKYSIVLIKNLQLLKNHRNFWGIKRLFLYYILHLLLVEKLIWQCYTIIIKIRITYCMICPLGGCDDH